MEQLKVGDTVVLKSGGPVMTVAKITRNKVLCGWFKTEEQDNPLYEEFDIAMLKQSV